MDHCFFIAPQGIPLGQNGPANPTEEITARRVLDTFDRSKVSEEIKEIG